jgi:hypothetical protein
MKHFSILSLLLISSTTFAYEPKLKITWGGFVDTQYAFDFNSPANGDRAYSTQPARTNEFNLNMGFIDVNINSDLLRGRFALQAGTSVQSNYAGEPSRGEFSGPDLARHIQEARIGYKISDKTWIDAGIFFAHVGAESWISRDNLTLTRSLVADFSPYYLSGVKLTHSLSDALTLQLLVTNGWQNISENNTDKNLGTGLEYSSKNFSIAYNTLIGHEVSPDLNATPRDGEFRHFHNFILRSKNTEFFDWIAQFDIGFQQKPSSSDYSSWLGGSLMGRYKIGENQKVSLRVEHFNDPDQVILVSLNQPESFNVFGGSIGFDQTLTNNLLWRTEFRYLVADEEIFPKNSSEFSKDNLTAVASLALTF